MLGVRVAGFSQILGLERTEIGNLPLFHFENEGRARTLESVRHNLQRTEVGDIHINRRDQLLVIEVAHLRAATVEGGEQLLLGASNHDRVGIAARRPNRIQRGLDQCFGQSPLRAIGRRNVGDRIRRNPRSAKAVIRGNPTFQTASLTCDRSRTRDGGRVVAQRVLNITLEFGGGLRHLLRHGVELTSRVCGLLRTGDADDLLRDLRAVRDASTRIDGSCRCRIVAFNLRIVRRRCENVSRPFVQCGGRLATATTREERRLSRGNHVNDVAQIFTIDDALVSLCGACWYSHDVAPWVCLAHQSRESVGCIVDASGLLEVLHGASAAIGRRNFSAAGSLDGFRRQICHLVCC